MKNSISNLMIVATLLLSFTTSFAQIKNAKTVSVKISGNCGMCEKNIEKAGNLKKVALVDWNKDTKMAILTYDEKKTSQDEILKRIALAGYDSESFLAPDDVYANLHGCCQYERVGKTPLKNEMKMESNPSDHSMHQKMDENHSGHTMNKNMSDEKMQNANQLDLVYTKYFAVKDALVKTDGTNSSSNAKELVSAINALKMNELEMDVHTVWMKVVATLKKDAAAISDTEDIKLQRDHFTSLSKNMYDLLKVSKQDTPTYYQFCPMANDGKGANWLSKENAVKNPYFGSQMLSCGKTVETIK